MIRTDDASAFKNVQNDLTGVNNQYGEQNIFEEENPTDPGQFLDKCKSFLTFFPFMSKFCGDQTNIYREVSDQQIMVRGIEMLIIKSEHLDMDTNKTYFVLPNTYMMNSWWIEYLILYIVLAVIVFQITFVQSWKKVHTKQK